MDKYFIWIHMNDCITTTKQSTTKPCAYFLGYTVNEIHGCLMSRRDLTSRHYNDVIMSTIASQITSLTIVYSTVYSGTDQRKHQSSASLAFVRGIHRGPVNSPHKGPVTRKMFPFDDVIMRVHHDNSRSSGRQDDMSYYSNLELCFHACNTVQPPELQVCCIWWDMQTCHPSTEDKS